MMFWDCESGEIVRLIDAEAQSVGFPSIPFSLFNLIQPFLSRFSGLVPVH